jgi:hypothetical protein
MKGNLKIKNRFKVTWYASYASCCPENPNYDPNADTTECDEYSACEYSGDFAAIGHQSFLYVMTHDLVAFYDNSDPDGANFMSHYGARQIQLSKNGVTFNATVADTCGNGDCDNCCSINSKPSGYLVDIEYYTALRRFGSTDAVDGTIEWKLLN